MSEHAAEATPYRIYLASSWRNPHQERCLEVLLRAGFAVYDFKHPNDSDSGFSWRTIDPEWKSWAKNPRAFFAGLRNRIAMEGFRLDMTALDVADACVLVLPAGNSAHLEAGFAIGKGKPTVIVCHEGFEPELMYLAVDLSDQRVSTHSHIVSSIEEAASLLADFRLMPRSDHYHWTKYGPVLGSQAPVFRTKKHLLSLRARWGVRKVLSKIASWTAAAFGSHLRNEVGDEDANAALAFLEEHGLDPSQGVGPDPASSGGGVEL